MIDLTNGAVRAIQRAGLVGLAAAVAACAAPGGPAPISAGGAPSGSAIPSADRVATPFAAPTSASPALSPSATPVPAGSQPPPVAGATPAVAALATPASEPAVVVVPEAPAKPEFADLWSRMRAGFSMPELDTPLVAEKERFYLQRPEALQRMFARGGRYLHFIVEEVEKRGMPTELALLPFVESAMNPVALSPAQAAGLWQFIPSTGKQYELSQNWWVDNRRDVVHSTRAALEYLQKIHDMHGNDWFLALASYNWGENAVARAVKRNQAKGLPTDYLSLSMPNETRHYVPKLIALKNILMRAPELGLALPELPNRPYFATIEKTRPIDLKLAAQFAGMTVDEFVALNPAHNRPVIAASRNNEIKLPAERVDQFVRALERHDRENKPLASWQPYTLKPGETLEDVARRGNVSAAELLRANGLAANRRILPGTQVLAPQQSVKDEFLVESFEGPRVLEQVTVPAVYHRVARRETLAGIAAEYGVPLDRLRAWNGGVKAVKPGARLLVRPAATQTIATAPDGTRKVIARAEPDQPPAPIRLGGRAAPPARASAAAPTAAAVPVAMRETPEPAAARATPPARTKAARPAARRGAAPDRSAQRKPAAAPVRTAAPSPARAPRTQPVRPNAAKAAPAKRT